MEDQPSRLGDHGRYPAQGQSMERKKRRLIRFSLRSMVIVVALFAIWLGLRTNRAGNQQRAVAAVLKTDGCFVQYDHEHGEDYWAMPATQRISFRKLHTHIPSRLELKMRGLVRPFFGTHYVDNVVTVGFSAAPGVSLRPNVPVNAKPVRKLTEEEWGYLSQAPKTRRSSDVWRSHNGRRHAIPISTASSSRDHWGRTIPASRMLASNILENTPKVEIIQLSETRVSKEVSDELGKRPNIRSINIQ